MTERFGLFASSTVRFVKPKNSILCRVKYRKHMLFDTSMLSMKKIYIRDTGIP